MNEDGRQADWIRSWIAQQREFIDKALGAGAQADPALRDLGLKWLDAGQSYLQGWAQFMGDAGATGSPQSGDKVGEELLNAWQGAWAGLRSTGASAAQTLSELLGRTPPLGLAREQLEAWRELAAAQAECQKLETELRAVMTRVQSDALALLERRVEELRQQGKTIASYRALYDLWVECSEKAYAEVAHSAPYSKLQAELANATMRLRTRLQTVVEGNLRQLDLPTRSELNTVHRQMRELRELRERVSELEKKVSDSSRGERS